VRDAERVKIEDVGALGFDDVIFGEHLLHEAGVLSNGSCCRQEPAVADLALFNVLGANVLAAEKLAVWILLREAYPFCIAQLRLAWQLCVIEILSAPIERSHIALE